VTKRGGSRPDVTGPGPAATPAQAAPPSPITTLDVPTLIGGAVALALLGLLVGSGGAFLQAYTVRVGTRLPVGTVFALLVLGAVAFSAALVARSKLGLGVVSVGWLTSVIVFTSGRPEGDVVIAADLPGYTFLFGGVVVLGALSTLPYSALPGPSSE
jgi:hypothetical protein